MDPAGHALTLADEASRMCSVPMQSWPRLLDSSWATTTTRRARSVNLPNIALSWLDGEVVP
jgi:hypothetical protein